MQLDRLYYNVCFTSHIDCYTFRVSSYGLGFVSSGIKEAD
jgi:hypothetical protein